MTGHPRWSSRPLRWSGWSKPPLVAAVLVAGVLAACTLPDLAPPDQDPDHAEESSMGFTNPVHDHNFPDPQILPDPDGGYVAIATNGNTMNIQVLTSDDMVTWQQGSDAMPELAEWTSPGKVWAPEAIEIADDRWAVYYTTRAPDPELQCVGVAFADHPAGPYADDSDGPLVCETDRGGSIDASPFRSPDGKLFLYWKNDGNAIGVDTWISVQELAADGATLVGEPTRLIKQDLPWEGNLVEGPYVVERDGTYHLFYSANDYGSADYAVGHATADSPTGPFTKSGDPILVSNEVAAGPGHCALIEVDGTTWMVYHAWDPDAIGEEPPGRAMWLSEVTFAADGSVRVSPPTVDHPGTP